MERHPDSVTINIRNKPLIHLPFVIPSSPPVWSCLAACILKPAIRAFKTRDHGKIRNASVIRVSATSFIDCVLFAYHGAMEGAFQKRGSRKMSKPVPDDSWHRNDQHTDFRAAYPEKKRRGAALCSGHKKIIRP
jgi:hypothetical protein